MRPSLEALCRLFIENRDTVKSVFAWESSYMHPVCAAIITDQGMHADEERLRTCKDIIKEKTGFFSNFRSNAMLTMIAMMSIDTDPSFKLDKALYVYNELKEYFSRSQYLPVASMMIADIAEPQYYSEVAVHSRRIYNLMRAKHPFLTSSEDSIYAAMLAMTKRPEDDLVSEIESCYHLLRNSFFSGNAVQALAHVLTLCEGTPEEKVRKTMDLFNTLKARGRKYGTSFELASLGVLAMLPEKLETIVEDMLEVDEFLSNQKGYGFLGLDRKQRLMHAGMIVTSDYLKNNRTMQGSAVYGTIALIVAQQAAICAAIAASNAANAGN